MNRRLFGTLGIMAALVSTVGSCKTDPLSDLNGAPAAIVKEFSLMHVAVGGNATFVASVVDGRLTPLPESLTFTSSSGVITVANDPTYDPQPPTSRRARVSGVSAGTAYVVIQGGGLRDSVQVIVP